MKERTCIKKKYEFKERKEVMYEKINEFKEDTNS
jgi:hypothetical protein